jgi:response regulator RpfG family c-di-GMP phosphodiesterase
MATYKILIVDDEINILNTLKRLLKNQDYEIVITTSQGVALDHLKNSPVAVIISDQRMPQMQGTHLLEKARSLSPETVRIMLTGYADMQSAMDAINIAAVHRYLTKPWIDAELVTIIRDAVRTYATSSKSKGLLKLMLKKRGETGEIEFDEGLGRFLSDSQADLSQLAQEPKDRPQEMLEMFKKMLHFHSASLSQHCQRVGVLCKRLSPKLSLCPQDAFDLELAAQLHDLGKVGIPESLFLKPEPELSDYERNLVDSHPSRAKQLLSHLPGMQSIAHLISCHHEHFDGSGYPKGLQGESIPRLSRILTVADQFDRAMDLEVSLKDPKIALKHLKDQTQRFDPEVLQVLESVVMPQKQRTREVRPEDLEPGMIVTQEVRTSSNYLLLAEFTKITDFHIEQIRNHEESDPILTLIHVEETRP